MTIRIFTSLVMFLVAIGGAEVIAQAPSAQAVPGRRVVVDMPTLHETFLPLTLAERLRKTDVVASVSVVSAARARAVDTTAYFLSRHPVLAGQTIVCPYTEWEVRVIETAKNNNSAAVIGTTLRIATLGGRAPFKDSDISMAGPEFTLERGGTYLVFLRFNESSGMLTFGAFDAFRIDRPTVSAVGRSGETPSGKQILDEAPANVMQLVREAEAQP